MEGSDRFYDLPRRQHQDIVELLDLNWFAGNVLHRSASTSTPTEPIYPLPSAPPSPKKHSQSVGSDVSALPQPLRSVRRNSLPESLVPLLPESQTPFSPDSVLQTKKLETILSGKTYDAEVEDDERSASGILVVESTPRRRRDKGRTKARRISRSLSELEFEEVKGFRDLGFTFPSAEVSHRLLRIVPGLQRLGIAPDSEGVDGDREVEAVEEGEERRRRPYLSEAWDFYDRRRCPLEGWKLPDDADGVEMREHLRTWAHRVASAVR